MPHSLIAALAPNESIADNHAMLDYAIRVMAERMTLRDFRTFVVAFVAANYADAIDADLTVGFGLGLPPAIFPLILNAAVAP
jgi:hypothetical protein